ncbi:hypothetical protein [Variovorax sp. EL159]|uniref:hypothetical protein n=1 Tax=Variovorax sp. EL159 TaxID=1566270 RepID=UPI0008855252|nr:hypothetical protein [Variovorax sp. EL159]SCX72058.1 hypothetical protein SAMN03159363_4116 [Variovorax sp. EL159]
MNTTMKRFGRAWVVGASIALLGAVIHAAPPSQPLQIGEGTTLRIVPVPRAKLASGTSVNLRWSPTLKRAIATSDDVFVAGAATFQQDGHTYFYLVTQEPSRENRGAGYCGAGTEDILRLIEIAKPPLHLIERDKLLLQSCLESIELDDASGASLRTQLEGRTDPQHLMLTWSAHPKFGSVPKRVTVRDGRLALE